jgi:hypothetical protein
MISKNSIHKIYFHVEMMEDELKDIELYTIRASEPNFRKRLTKLEKSTRGGLDLLYSLKNLLKQEIPLESSKIEHFFNNEGEWDNNKGVGIAKRAANSLKHPDGDNIPDEEKFLIHCNHVETRLNSGLRDVRIKIGDNPGPENKKNRSIYMCV